jgi:hypothetical protein
MRNPRILVPGEGQDKCQQPSMFTIDPFSLPS